MSSKTRAVVVLLALAIMGSTACFGSFNLTRKIYNWNDSPDDKWVKEGYFLVTGVLLPLYSLAALADALVFNSIEFWTGEHPVAMSPADGEEEQLLGQSQDGGEEVSIHLVKEGEQPFLRVVHRVDGRTAMVLRVVREGQETFVTDAQGERVLTATHRSDGSMLVQRGEGQTVAFFGREDVNGYIRGILTGHITPSVFASDHFGNAATAVAP